MKKIILSKEFDPYFNIAAEHQLFLESDEDPHLFLWQNDASVVIGRNQNLYAECDLPYLQANGIKAVRRFSGGGAVYQDRGNVNFTFITKEKAADQTKFSEQVRAALARLGVACAYGGRNDLLYQGQKFSGHAHYADGDNYMYHGTVLVGVNLDRLEKALTPSRLKLQSKGIASVRSRVVNLSLIDHKITVENVMQAFMEAFECEDIHYIDKTHFHAPLEWMLSSHDWLYAQSPKFDIELERGYPFGNISVYISVADDRIQSIEINTDSLRLYDFKSHTDRLIGKCFSEEAVWEFVEEIAGSA